MMPAGALDRHGGLTTDTALQLGQHFGTSAQYWLNQQACYDLAVAQAARAPRLVTEVRPGSHAALGAHRLLGDHGDRTDDGCRPTCCAASSPSGRWNGVVRVAIRVARSSSQPSRPPRHVRASSGALESERLHGLFVAADCALVELARWGHRRAGMPWELAAGPL
jgi:hypothetical protein